MRESINYSFERVVLFWYQISFSADIYIYTFGIEMLFYGRTGINRIIDTLNSRMLFCEWSGIDT